ncbi:MAG: hypothetical protein AAB861_00420 [Patescibacteria group bacterium]
MKNNSNKTQNVMPDGVGGRLEALIALTAGVLRSVAKDPKSKQVSIAEDKAIVALFSVGVPQIEIGKLLGVDTHRVNDICKKLKK